MSVTRKQIASNFNVPLGNVEQIGSKQLFTVSVPKGDLLVVSYYTVVGKFSRATREWIFTIYKYSRTTTAPLKYFRQCETMGYPIYYTDKELTY